MQRFQITSGGCVYGFKSQRKERGQSGHDQRQGVTEDGQGAGGGDMKTEIKIPLAADLKRRVISEFRPIVSLERVVNICVIKGLTQAHLIESFFKRKFAEKEIDIKPDRQQISGALQRLSKAGKVERRQSMWRPVNL